MGGKKKEAVVMIGKYLIALILLCGTAISFAAETSKSSSTVWWLDDLLTTQNILYSPLMIQFWKIMQEDIVKEDVQFFRNVSYQDRMNQSKISKTLFPEKVAMTDVFYGYLLKDIAETFKQKRESSIGVEMPDFEGGLGLLDVLGYIGLGRHVSLPQTLFSTGQPLLFSVGDKHTPVKGMLLDYQGNLGEDPMQKVNVIEYNNPDDFIVGLTLQDYNDEMYIAKVAPLATFQDTVKYVLKRIVDGGQQMFFMPGDQLHIPQIAVDSHSLVPDLQDNGVQNKTKKSWFLSKVVQDYRFEVRADGEYWQVKDIPFMTQNIHMNHLDFVSDRRYIVDKPFLCLMRHQGETEPYLALWIKDTQFLEEA